MLVDPAYCVGTRYMNHWIHNLSHYQPTTYFHSRYLLLVGAYRDFCFVPPPPTPFIFAGHAVPVLFECSKSVRAFLRSARILMV